MLRDQHGTFSVMASGRSAVSFERLVGGSSSSTVDEAANSSGLQKWQLALLFAAPIVIGAGAYYWYYTQSSARDVKKPPANGSGRKPVNGTIVKGSEAHQAKEKGNSLFKQAKYADAIQAYSDAIRLCAPEKTSELATYYQNRAAAYDSIKKYQEVIEDCNEAIKHNRKYIKALQRRAKGNCCLARLTRFDLLIRVYLCSLRKRRKRGAGAE